MNNEALILAALSAILTNQISLNKGLGDIAMTNLIDRLDKATEDALKR